MYVRLNVLVAFVKMSFIRMVVLLFSVLLVFGDIPFRAKTSYYREGQFIIGGLFPVYRYSQGNCVSLRTSSVYKAELMVYAVNQINSRSDILPNVTLGFDIRPYCDDESIVVSVALSMAGVGGSTRQGSGSGKFIGIVGPGTSVSSVATAIATTVHNIPVVSYGGSSMELSDKSRFPYFLRTWPPGTFQAAAIVDILIKFKWSYVGLMYSRNTYGIHGAEEIEKLAEVHNICLAYSVPLSETTEWHEIDTAVEKILTFNMAKVVIVFVYPPSSGMIVLKALMEARPDHPGIILVSCDYFGFVSHLEYLGVANLTRGSIAVRSYFKEVSGFKNYFRSIQVEGRPMSTWLKILQDFRVSSYPNCDEISQCPLNCTTSCDNHYVADAVYSFASALNAVLNQQCKGNFECLVNETSGPVLLSFLRNSSFPGVDGLFTFDAHGHPGAKYHVIMQQFINGGHREVNIGFWDSRSEHNNRLNMTVANLPWPQGEMSPPRSVCRDPCLPGYVSVPLDIKCCYGCQRCSINTIVFNGTDCRPCADFYWPNADYTNCEIIEPPTTEWKSPLVCVILGLTFLSALLTSCAGLGLLHYRQHPLIKATGRELSSVNILGLLLSCLTVIPLLTNPTTTSCSIADAMIALSLTLTYAPTLLKVNRIYRIFQGAKKSKKRPKFVSPMQQLILASGLTAVQILMVIVTSIISPSVPKLIQPSTLKKRVDIFCFFRAGFLTSLVYNLLLILACCFYAFKTRKVPSHYNESKFIAVSVYSTLLLGTAAVLVYTTAVAVLTMKVTLCMVVLLNAYLTLACMYLPKLYAARYIQDLNVLGVRGPSSANAEAGASGGADCGSSSLTVMPLTNSRRRCVVHPEPIQLSDTI